MKVYPCLEEVRSLNQSVFGDEQDREIERYTEDMREHCKMISQCEHAGDMVKFQIKDGHAYYMIVDYKTLVHMPFYDGYKLPDAYLQGLNKEHLINNAEQQKYIAALFAEKH